jgi:HEAT repeat protein
MSRLPVCLLALAAVGYNADAADQQEPSYKGRPMSAWVADLKSKDPDARFDAAIALGRMGPATAAAVPNLIGLFEDKDEDVAVAVTIALRRIGKPAVPALIRALRDKDTRFHAAGTLRRIGAPAVAPLMQALRDPNEDVRRGAESALRWMGGRRCPRWSPP